jgi:hypothetical protein
MDGWSRMRVCARTHAVRQEGREVGEGPGSLLSTFSELSSLQSFRDALQGTGSVLIPLSRPHLLKVPYHLPACHTPKYMNPCGMHPNHVPTTAEAHGLEQRARGSRGGRWGQRDVTARLYSTV